MYIDITMFDQINRSVFQQSELNMDVFQQSELNHAVQVVSTCHPPYVFLLSLSLARALLVSALGIWPNCSNMSAMQYNYIHIYICVCISKWKIPERDVWSQGPQFSTHPKYNISKTTRTYWIPYFNPLWTPNGIYSKKMSGEGLATCLSRAFAHLLMSFARSKALGSVLGSRPSMSDSAFSNSWVPIENLADNPQHAIYYIDQMFYIGQEIQTERILLIEMEDSQTGYLLPVCDAQGPYQIWRVLGTPPSSSPPPSERVFNINDGQTPWRYIHICTKVQLSIKSYSKLNSCRTAIG